MYGMYANIGGILMVNVSIQYIYIYHTWTLWDYSEVANLPIFTVSQQLLSMSVFRMTPPPKHTTGEGKSMAP